MACLFGHKWDGCKCIKCGITRDENHVWAGCRCGKCGKTRNEGHQWADNKCNVCGAIRDAVPHQTMGDKPIDQSAHIEAALNGNREALNFVEDAEALYDIAVSLNNVSQIYCMDVIKKLMTKDNVKTIDVVKKAKDWMMRCLAVQMIDIDDDELFYNIAINDENEEVRRYAMKRIKDESLKTNATEKQDEIKFDVSSLCAKINSDIPRDRWSAAEDILKMRDKQIFTTESRVQMITSLLQGMKRPVPDSFDYSLAANYQLNFNGNLFIGQLLSQFYKDTETSLEDKTKIESLNGQLVSYNDYEGRRSPVYFDCNKGFKI